MSLIGLSPRHCIRSKKGCRLYKFELATPLASSCRCKLGKPGWSIEGPGCLPSLLKKRKVLPEFRSFCEELSSSLGSLLSCPLAASQANSDSMTCCPPWNPAHGAKVERVRLVKSDFEKESKGAQAPREKNRVLTLSLSLYFFNFLFFFPSSSDWARAAPDLELVRFL